MVTFSVIEIKIVVKSGQNGIDKITEKETDNSMLSHAIHNRAPGAIRPAVILPLYLAI